MANHREIAEEATAFLPAIEALQSDLTSLEKRAAETRALIEQLCARAGIANPPDGAVTAIPASAKRSTVVATRTPHARRRRSPRVSRTGTVKPTTAPAKPGNDVAELAKIVASVAETADLVAAAMREKDAEKLRAAIAARAHAERRAGRVLIALAGKKPLPGVSKIESRRWRRAATLVPDALEARIGRATRKALKAISSSGAAAVAAIGARPKEKAPKKRRNRTSLANMPRQKMELTPWQKGPDGSLSRTLTAVDDAATAAT
jgi:hypothetical protein